MGRDRDARAEHKVGEERTGFMYQVLRFPRLGNLGESNPLTQPGLWPIFSVCFSPQAGSSRSPGTQAYGLMAGELRARSPPSCSVNYLHGSVRDRCRGRFRP